jgi:transposase
MFEELQRLESAVNDAEAIDSGSEGKPKGSDTLNGQKPKGRRDLCKSTLPVVRVEIDDPALECLIAQGRGERIGFEESSRLGYERGGMRRIVVARVVYKLNDATAESPAEIKAAPLPKELFSRGLLAPSMIAHLLVAKYMMGVPFYRLEQKLAFEGATLDRGTMSRYAEDVGATLGAIVEAARQEAFETAFCLATDATGFCIQPGASDGSAAGAGRRPCKKGHFFVILADRDHVFFDYQPKHTSRAVCEMFRGFSGYVQADAHAIYDALFRGEATTGPPPTEVGCFSHCRRNFWDAAACKHRLGVEGLRRIDAIFKADRQLATLAPAKRQTQRHTHVRPLVDAFFEWVKEEHARPRERGLVSKALGYAVHQQAPLRRLLEDGRLRLENNAAERALRTIATGRKSWIFFGSDDHAHAAANLFSLVASCKLHALDPEDYLANVLRVMPYWPRDRYIELSPKHWAHTRTRLDPSEMARPLGRVTVPPPHAAQEQALTG